MSLIDPNQPNSLNREQLKQLAKKLDANGAAVDNRPEELREEMQPWSQGIVAGLTNYQQLEPQLVSWLYQSAGSNIGFGSKKRNGAVASMATAIGRAAEAGIYRLSRRSAARSHHSDGSRYRQLGQLSDYLDLYAAQFSGLV